MAELVLIKAIVGSRVADVLCPTCGRISRQILSKSYSQSVQANLLREYECPLCNSTYSKCDSTFAYRWSSAVLNYNRDADAYNQSVKENYQRQKSATPSPITKNSPNTTSRSEVLADRGGIPSLISVLEQHSEQVSFLSEMEKTAPVVNGPSEIKSPPVLIESPAPVPKEGKALPVLHSCETTPTTNALMDEVLSRKTARWKRELLDTSKRNRMINYRETARATLRILEPDAETLFR